MVENHHGRKVFGTIKKNGGKSSWVSDLEGKCENGVKKIKDHHAMQNICQTVE